IPFSRDPDFVNRGDILDRIHVRCSEPAGRVALVGLGGVGKSQLAIECAYRVAAEQTDKWIFWIHAGTQARVEEGFRTIADAVKLPGRNQPKADIPQLVYSWLSNERNSRWVIVLDSADDSDVFYSTTGPTPKSKPLATYLPQSRNGAILVTTRNKNLARRLTGNDANILDVGPMVEADALSLLKKKLGLLDIDRATELVRVLEYVPLAISQAAGYIRARAPRSSPEKYLDEFRAGERKRIKLLGHDGGDLRRDGSASNAILTTWQISFEHICSKRPSATDLLSLMSFFDRQGISESLLKDSDEDMFEDDVAMLRDYCLVSTNEAGDVFEMHGLVQLSTRKWLEARGLQEKFKAQFVKRMAMSFPTGDYSNWLICRRLFVHVEKAMGCRPADGEMEEVWARLLYNGGWYAWSQGQYEIAERMVDKARRTREKRLGREDEASLQSVLLYASVMKARGRWKEAESLEVQVMETFKRVLGEDHPSTLTSMGNLALTYMNQGRWKEAESLEVQVMETSSRVLGKEHPWTLTSMNNLALTFWNQGRWKEAELLNVQVMETRKRVSGEEHPETLTSMNNLALTFENQGRWKEAELLNVQVMETRKRVSGEEHPETLTSMNNLALTFENQGRWKEAESLEVQVMETRKRVLGEEHPDTLNSMANLAFTWEYQGRHSDA
ncbi:P-loop containing nucleoside triphosphate hydrolase protein, partial [Rhypophila decipiens]